MIFELFESTSTKVFALLIALVFLIAIALDKEGKRKRFIEYAPTLMTSLGILGTFWGVVLGLLDFDTINIDRSIPNLLSGLKTAFVTSILGMLASISFNALDSWRFADKRDEQDAEQKIIHDSILKQTELLSEIKQGLAGSDDDSLISQLKLLQTNWHNHSYEFDTKLWKQFEEFSDKISKGATEQIIDALRLVVIDFNNRLTEQFGDNFKALDSSVKKMVDWQATYKEQLSLMDNQFRLSVESLTSISEAVVVIGEHCNNIPVTMVDLQSIIQTNQSQLVELERHLEAFVMMRDQAITAIPLLREGIEGIGSLMASSADNLQEVLEHSGQRLLTNIERMNKSMDLNIQQMSTSIQHAMNLLEQMGGKLLDGNSQICSVMGEGVQKISDNLLSGNEKIRFSIEQGVSKIGDELLSSNNKIRNEMERGVHTIGNELLSVNDQMRINMENIYHELQATTEKSITLFNETINKQRYAFEQATEQEITRELEIMGKALLQISQGFVNNYEQLIRNYEVMTPKIDVKYSDMEKRS